MSESRMVDSPTLNTGGLINGFPPLVMGWLSGMFAAIWTGAHGEPALGPVSAGVFAITTGGAALGLAYLRERGLDG